MQENNNEEKEAPLDDSSSQDGEPQQFDRRAKYAQWLRVRAPSLGLLALGFFCGALVVGVRSCAGDLPGKGGTDPHAAHAQEAASQAWTCSMHPQIQKNEPGQCPICGMDLIPVGGSRKDTENDGPAIVRLSERAAKLAQLRTSVVRRRSDSAGDVRLLGRIEPNESTLKTVTAWTGGRIDRLHVNTTGETVKGGQSIATLYSPEVFAAHQDLITANAQVQRMSEGAESSRRAAEAALGAARQRLALLGVPDGELARMAKQTKPATAVSIRTPFGGTVMERLATEGTYVTTGAPLYRIANLSSLWIQLDAYEGDLPLLNLEQTVRIEVEAYPGEEFEGKITFIDPTVDAQKRTTRVRVEVGNEDGRLRPGMFAQAVVAADAEKGPDAPLVVPATAPLFTGRRAIVYVEVPSEVGSVYEARTVRLGPRLGNLYPVVAGLSEGDRIVTRGAFALDADLQIRGGSSMMYSPDDRQPGQWDNIVHIPRSELRRLAPVVAAYLSLQRALADDDLALSQAAATKIEEELVAVSLENPEGKKAWEHLSKQLDEHAKHVVQANSLEHAREGFEGLSGTVVMLLRILGNPLDGSVALAHCPMARGSQGASWIQDGSDVNNSYFGESMLSCGDIVDKVGPGEHLATPHEGKKEIAAPQPAGGHNH